MPELPEVEVTRLSFADRITQARIVSVAVGKPLRWPLGCLPSSLVGRSIVAVRRRGKYLLFDLDLDQGLLLVHLGMSGSLSFADDPPPAGAHDHFELLTTRGVLRLHDPRRFGAVVFASGEEAPMAKKLLGRLGMEPLAREFDPLVFARGLKARRACIKQVLLAGELVVGVGNIYASEALFQARIRPTARASGLSRARSDRLHRAVQDVLGRAVERGGSTLRDFSNADGAAGHYQLEAMVYGREGLPCRVCGSTVKSIRQGQRSSFFCHTCQRN